MMGNRHFKQLQLDKQVCLKEKAYEQYTLIRIPKANTGYILALLEVLEHRLSTPSNPLSMDILGNSDAAKQRGRGPGVNNFINTQRATPDINKAPVVGKFY
ncbi:hypothetical protein DCAR_0729701 [Daucus carota subsp. sativus]|uniref:Uncharacterized protein n=1 Tax=Daucus carota subsp. sativus TaxID=79200 RepID=A0A164UE72_DAUCS|nr:hypothetical protein DCAR_0729701 [Daucus carota subsp. sativus]